MDQRWKDELGHTLARFCVAAGRVNRQVAIVTGAGDVSRHVACALVDRKYAVLIVSRSLVKLHSAYQFAIGSQLGYSPRAASFGKVVGTAQVDLADLRQVSEFVDLFTRHAATTSIMTVVVVHAAGKFAWDSKATRDELMIANNDTKQNMALAIFACGKAFSGVGPWSNTRHVFVGSVAAGFESDDMLKVTWPSAWQQTQYFYVAAQQQVRKTAEACRQLFLPALERVLLLEPAGMKDTAAMQEFPPAIRDQVTGTVRSEVVEPLLAFLEGRSVVRTTGVAISSTT